MQIRRGISLIFFLFLLPAVVMAQETIADTTSLQLFRRGEELYQKRFYGASQQVLRQYLQRASPNNRSQQAEANYYIAMSAMELFQADAELLLKGFAENYPEHPQARLIGYRLGQFYFRNKEYEKAAQAFSEVNSSLLPPREKGDYLFMAGYSYFRQEDYEKAKPLFEELKSSDHTQAALGGYYYGYIAYEQGDYKTAIAEFEKLRDQPKYGKLVNVYIIQIYLLQENYDKVIAVGEKAVQDPETAELDKIRLALAEAYFQKGQFEKAAEQYEAYGSLPSDHHAYQYGYALFNARRFADAVQVFNQVSLEEDTLGQNASYHLGASYIQTGEKNKARNAFDFARNIEIESDIRQLALLNYAKLSYELNYHKEAIDALRAFSSRYPRSPYTQDANRVLSQVLSASNNPKEAIDVIESIPSYSNDPELQQTYQKATYQHGVELYSAKQYDDAEKMFEKSLNTNRDRRIRALTLFWLAESEYQQKDYSNAANHYKYFITMAEAKNTPYYDLASYGLGYSYFHQEDYSLARTYFERYLSEQQSGARSARYTDAQLRAADAHFVLKNYTQALQYYNAVISSNIQEGDYATYQKAIIQGLQGNNENKVTTLRSIATRFPKSKYVDDAIFEIGETYLNTGSYDKAVEAFQELSRNHPNSIYKNAALLKLGLAYYNQERDDQAIATFQSIIDNSPSSPEAAQARSAIETIYVETGQTAKLEKFYQENPGSRGEVSSKDSSLYASAFSNVRRGDCKAAITSLEQYLDNFPNGAYFLEAHFYAGECAIKTGSRVKAVTHLEAVISRTPNKFGEDALRYITDLYMEDKDYAKAYTRYGQLEEYANNQANTITALLGQMRTGYILNKHADVLQAATRLLNLGYANEQARLEAQLFQGKSHLALGKIDEAQAEFLQVANNSKNALGAEATYYKAYVDFMRERYDDVQTTVMSLQEKFSYYDYWVAKGFILLADTYVKLGDKFNAKATLQSIIDNYDNDTDDIKSTAREKLKQIS